MGSEKNWNFDKIIDRSNTGSMKWEPGVLRRQFGQGRENLLPLWVADMDFLSPLVVRQAMEERLAHQIYGYTIMDQKFSEALILWYKRRHQWEIDPDWILTTPGVVPATNYLIQRFSMPGDKVLIQTPVYYPFARSIVNNGRLVLENPLKISEGRYQMDFDDLAKKVADPRVKLAILCSPHNPVGRVWTKEELERFGKICMENNVLVFADEIHCDLIMPGFKHICFQDICDEFAQNSITANAASKTFNLAGLHQSSLIIPNEKLRNEFSIYFETLGVDPRGNGTTFGAIATTAAYNGAEPWLDDLILYLWDNFIYLKITLEEQLPGVKVFDLEGTYLAWVDFNPLGLSPEKIIQIIEEEAGVALDHGNWFADNGAGFERFNIACPRSILEKAVKAVTAGFKKYL
ncbi:MAG: pyridoxal phosphate-dependent aminotransferase [Desulfobacteraceae bacterium]|nr:pyridoxal phosphate-dependent aminotransferase [Desulfobacteraceae bacterium]